MDNMCMHCLEEGNWEDEDKCPKCKEAGHTSPWGVNQCLECNRQYERTIEKLKAKVGFGQERRREIFEYKLFSDFKFTAEQFNELGKDGWELCGVVPQYNQVTCVFKRKVWTIS